MLETFRRLIRGWLGKVLITIFILPFAFFGVSSIFQSAGVDTSVAEVNGIEIEERDLLRAIEIQKQNLIARFGDQFPQEMLSTENLLPSVLKGMIDRELLMDYANDSGHQISIDEIHNRIRQSAAFQENGQFSQPLFEQLIRRTGMQPSKFTQEMKKDLVGDQIRSGYAVTAFATDSEIDTLIKLNNQQREISYLQIPLNKIKDQVDVSEEEIEQYYDENKEKYKTPEQVALEYIELKQEDFSVKVEVSEEDIRDQFEIKIADLENSQQREASHILISLDERNETEAKKIADEVHGKINADNFAELAKEYSDDPGSAENGGNLGLAGRGVYVKEFEDALFELQIGEITPPLLTEFGYHIITLHKVEPQLPELENIREELIEEAKMAKAEQPYLEKLEELKALVYEASDLLEPSEFIGKEIKHTGFISRAGGSGMTSNPAVLETAFSEEVLNEGFNSEVIELSDSSAVVVRAKDHKPASYKELEQVKNQIKLTLEHEKSKSRLKEVGVALAEKIKSGESYQEDLDTLGISWTDKKEIKRNEAGIPREISQQSFKLPKVENGAEVVEGVALNNGDYAIIRLTNILDKTTVEESEQEKIQMKQALGGQKGQGDFARLTSWLRETGKIVKKEI